MPVVAVVANGGDGTELEVRIAVEDHAKIDAQLGVLSRAFCCVAGS